MWLWCVCVEGHMLDLNLHLYQLCPTGSQPYIILLVRTFLLIPCVALTFVIAV